LSDVETATCKRNSTDELVGAGAGGIELACPPYRGQWELKRTWPGEQPSMATLFAEEEYLQIGSRSIGSIVQVGESEICDWERAWESVRPV
jgi:hypothetical protein